MCAACVSPAGAQSVWRNVGVGGGSTAVHSLLMDSRGLLWVGANDGLYTYDGNVVIRMPAADDSFGFQAYSLVAQGSDTLWVGTNNGLMAMDIPTRRLAHASFGSPNEIRALALHGGRLWVGSLNGLYVRGADGKLHPAGLTLPHRAVYALAPAGAELYIGTYDGLARYDSRTGRVVRVDLGVCAPFVNSLRLDSVRRVLWVGTERELLRYDLRGRRVTSATPVGSAVKSLDLTGDDVVAGTDDGVCIVSPGAGPRFSRHDSRSATSPANNNVWALLCDRDGNIIAGTEAGLSISSRNMGVAIMPLAELTGSGAGNRIQTMLRDSAGTLWLGGSNGLLRLASGSDPRWFMPASPDSYISHNHIRDIFEDSRGEVWVATDGGLNRYDAPAGRFVNYRVEDAATGVNANWCYNVVEDSRGRLWTGSYLGGVMVIDRDSLRGAGTTHPSRVIGEGSGLANSLVNSLVTGRDGAMWVMLFRDSLVTRIDGRAMTRVNVKGHTGYYPTALMADITGDIWSGAGPTLLRTDARGGSPRVYRLSEDNPNEHIAALARVGDRIWAVTGTGVWTLDPGDGSSHLLPLPAMQYQSILNDTVTGRVLLGADDRLVAVDPAWIARGARGKRIHIMSVSVNDSVVDAPFFDGTAPDVITLDSPADRLSLRLSALDYDPSRVQRYAWRIRGVTGETLLADGDNTLTLPKLAPGDYGLELYYCDAGDTRLTLRVRVLQPWYLRWYMLAAYALLIAAIIVLVVIYIRRRERRRRLQRLRDATLESSRRKIEFLTGVAHELYRPLARIVGPVCRLRDAATDEASRGPLAALYDDALSINRMVHRTVEFDHDDIDGGVPLIVSRVEVTAFVRGRFGTWAASHPDRLFMFEAPDGDIHAVWDVVRMESVLDNLLDNACKYSDDGATVTVTVRRAPGVVQVTVADTGCGIDPEDCALVFERMYRCARTAATHPGTGMGLYLVRSYVEMQGGRVTLDSTPGVGSAFTFTMPAEPVSPVAEVPAGAPQEPEARPDEAAAPLPDAAGRQLADITRIIDENIDDSQLSVTFVCDRAGLNAKQLYRLVKRYTGLTPVEYIRSMRLRKAAMLLEQNKFTVSEVMYMCGFSSPGYFSKCFAAAYGVTPGRYAAAQPPE